MLLTLTEILIIVRKVLNQSVLKMGHSFYLKSKVSGGVCMLYALRFFDTERSLWYLDCVHRSKLFLKRREKKFLKRGIKTTISKWYGI